MKAAARRSTRIWGLDQYGVSFDQLPYLGAIHHNLSLSLCWELWHTRKVYIPRECHCMCLNPLPTNAVLYINRSCPQLLMSANTDFGTSVLPKN